ncbi:DUF459 domain-containing protein [Fulvimarina endophytica]|uniref:DUF459 domain-containing protein n=1 Tax=Fulvimarina endophytica TaxID=2293836 RepID=A0A371X712_9HYPH|nr:SGNH family hydrolase [Fulvimarina endophytica]RFC64997.1 DUF459 domain-containing protein [Fulvimarina endophytica]
MTATATARHRDIAARRPSLRAVTALLAFVIAVTAVLPDGRAYAQQRPKTIVEMLFGQGNRSVETRPTVRKRVIRKKKRISNPRARPEASRSASRKPAASRPSSSAAKRTGTAAGATGAAAAASGAAAGASAPIDKNADAKTILVVGDFLADGLADGLSAQYADDEMIEVVARTNGSSGLVRQDFYDWPAELGPLIDEIEPDVLTVMIGANDRQPMKLSGGILAVRSDGWTAEYEKRATDLARVAEEKNVPVIWIGMPSFKFDAMSEDMVFLNDIYKRAAERVSGEFVSVWDGFVDEAGGFVYSGPDINGQNARLRAGDGIAMTEAGKEKLAFFAEKALSRVLGEISPQVALGEEALSTMQLPPATNAANAAVAAPIALGDLSQSGSDDLLGTQPAGSPFAFEPSPRDRLVLKGDQMASQDGRADNFAWNTKTDALRTDPPVLYRGTIDLKTITEGSGIEPPPEMPNIFDAIIEDWKSEETAPGETAR